MDTTGGRFPKNRITSLLLEDPLDPLASRIVAAFKTFEGREQSGSFGPHRDDRFFVSVSWAQMQGKFMIWNNCELTSLPLAAFLFLFGEEVSVSFFGPCSSP